MTAQALIEASLRLIGELTSGRTANTYEYADCLSALNQMLSNWSDESLPVFQLVREQFALTGAASYTLGPSGDFNTVRPLKIRAAQVQASNGAALPVRPVPAEEFAQILDTTSAGSFAELMHVDGGYPLVTIRLWPKPANTSVLILVSVKALSSIALLGDPVAFPPGYEDALVYNLAVRVAPQFKREPSAAVVAIAQQTKAALTTLNAQVLGGAPPQQEAQQ